MDILKYARDVVFDKNKKTTEIKEYTGLTASFFSKLNNGQTSLERTQASKIQKLNDYYFFKKKENIVKENLKNSEISEKIIKLPIELPVLLHNILKNAKENKIIDSEEDILLSSFFKNSLLNDEINIETLSEYVNYLKTKQNNETENND